MAAAVAMGCSSEGSAVGAAVPMRDWSSLRPRYAVGPREAAAACGGPQSDSSGALWAGRGAGRTHNQWRGQRQQQRGQQQQVAETRGSSSGCGKSGGGGWGGGGGGGSSGGVRKGQRAERRMCTKEALKFPSTPTQAVRLGCVFA